MQIDFLIVGQGLAGSLLAWELIRRDFKVVVVDNGSENASQVAAGLINPVSGMRFVKSAEIETLFPAAKQCYSSLESFFQQAFWVDKSMLRLFQSENEAKFADKRRSDSTYQDYLRFPSADFQLPYNLHAPYGFIQQTKTGFLLTKRLLDSLRTFLVSRNCYRKSELDYPALRLYPKLIWQDLCPKTIIFCEGHKAIANPWFAGLPFQPAKGEILTYQYDQNLQNILHLGSWLIPVSNSKIRLGASFDRINLNCIPTEEAKMAITKPLKTINMAFSDDCLVAHQAGIRPCTMDKQPFIGSHPVQTQLHMFNGFGSKGSLIIPWYSQQFADYLQFGKPLSTLCNVHRYSSYIA